MNITADNTRQPIVRTWRNTRTGATRQETIVPIILTEPNGVNHKFYQGEQGEILNMWNEAAKITVDVTKYYK